MNQKYRDFFNKDRKKNGPKSNKNTSLPEYLQEWDSKSDYIENIEKY